MKKVLILSMVVISTMAVAQTVTYEQIEGATDPKSQFQKEYQEYVASDGHTYKVGDKVTIGMPQSNKTYAFLTSELAVAAAIMGGGPVPEIGASYAGNDMEIKQIKVSRNKKRGAQVTFHAYLSGLGGVIIQIENAITAGEIVSLGMSPDKALVELKKAKDKLDLEVITQQEFDSIKAELAPYLK